ncbi:MAG: SAM-dependent methyltransferase [Candidatus Heimdallarchaeota archaeon]|nr:MAG: SAM-dependent methyltransferase [Candidatus Heimdallarchaeota archaeon]
MNKQRRREFGDFQTPNELSSKITCHLKQLGFFPASIIEPTCGTGSFIFTCLDTFSEARIIGIDINSNYLNLVSEKLSQIKKSGKVELRQGNFFELDWQKEVEGLTKPILIIGNPPWVTSSEITILGGANIPIKSNIHGFQGLDTKTGKSNFDISEWMIIELLKALNGHSGILAMLCKVAVARKVLIYAKKEKISVFSSKVILIDAKEYFGASVDACLFICHVKPASFNYTCHIYESFDSNIPIQEIGYIDERMVANIPLYKKWRHLIGNNTHIWRSGIKHDCTRVMELLKQENGFLNGFGELVSLEDNYLYPMLKSSDLANNRIKNINRRMIVTQKSIGEDTSSIQQNAPLTWEYLKKYAHFLLNRASSIYQNRPQFSVFGVGSYTFSSWKVAISGFYKELKFRLIKPFEGKPVVLDDTCYFLPAKSHEEAAILLSLLDHPITHEFYHSFIYWDAKRPITKQVLQQLDLKKLFREISYPKLLDILQHSNQNIPRDLLAYKLKQFS